MAATLKPAQIDEIEARLARISDPSLLQAARRALTEEAMETSAERTARMKLAIEGIREIQKRIAALPVLDTRSTREIQNELNQDILDSHR